jgi:DNA repair exonuclease SbcCD ATPase subunit
MKPIRLTFLVLALLLVASTVSAAHDSYVFHFGGDRNSMTMSGSLEDFMAIRGQLDGDYLWVRHGGKSYVITDRARLAEVWDYFAPQRALRPEQKEIERQTRKLEKESDALEDVDDRALTFAEQSRLEELHAQERELSRRERTLDEREEELERIAERKLWQLVDRSIDNGSARAIR